MIRLLITMMLSASCVLTSPICFAQEHEHGPAAEEPAPTIFLDKSPRVVEFQLRQLSNKQLASLERKTDHIMYAPIYFALLTRPGLDGKYRKEAVEALVKLNKSSAAGELIAAIVRVDEETDEETLTQRQAMLEELGAMLLREKKDVLTQKRDELVTLAGDGNDARAKEIGYGAMMVADGAIDQAMQLTTEKENGQRYLFGSAALIKDKAILAAIYPAAESAIGETSDDVTRHAAMDAVSFVPGKEEAAFSLLSGLLIKGNDAAAAAGAIKRIPAAKWPETDMEPIAHAIVKLLEATDADARTWPASIDATQLGYELAGKLSAEKAAPIKKALGALGVRVIVLKAPPEQMVFDQKWFAVEAGKQVQVIFQNTDVMPHNFVVVAPGALEEIGTAAETMQPSNDPSVKQFIPKSEKILAAMQLVQLGQTGRLSFTAPTEPGEYPYVCTYPGHWRRMYGVMVVVKDLDAFNASPVEPKDPLGNTRSLVKQWTPNDFKDKLLAMDKSASAERGAIYFSEAGCVLCHKVQGKGGMVGPELTEVFKKWKGNRADVLREILEPSKVIDEKYRPQIIETSEGDRLFGLVTGETDDAVMIVTNPQNPVPQKVLKSNIEDRTKGQTSMMPLGLMNIFKESEVLDVLRYLETGGAVKGHEH